MSVVQLSATYQRLRQAPMWSLLASTLAPTTLSLLQTHLFDGPERQLPSSVLHQRIGRDLDLLRQRGENLPQTAQIYIRTWVTEGLLKREFPVGATEEMYELTVAAIDAIRVVSGIERPHDAATESRLAVVVNAIEQLARDTDTDKFRRIDRLKKEQERIQAEIDALADGPLRVLPTETAKERVREVISLAHDAVEDFSRVSDKFNQLHRGLRENIVKNEGSRGEVLEDLFNGINVMEKSDAGRSFKSFWRLLTNKVMGATLEQALQDILSRKFINELDRKERRFLECLIGELHGKAKKVHAVQQQFAKSLRNFVQSREYLEQRRLHQALKEAQGAALEHVDTVRASDKLEFILTLTGATFSSMAQYRWHDPSLTPPPAKMEIGAPAVISMSAVNDMIAHAEIDFRGLRKNIRTLLETKDVITVADLVDAYPATQGLGTIVGYLSLGSRYGAQAQGLQLVSWTTKDTERAARIPTVLFTKDTINELPRT